MADITEEHLQEYIDLCNQRWGIKVVEKKHSLFMRALGVLLFFNKSFMERYITTIGKTIYWPNWDKAQKRPQSTLDTYFHEAQHAYDYIKYHVFFILSYISPQIWALLALLAFLAIFYSSAWLAALAFVILVAPIPAYFRALWEWRGASCNLAFSIWRDGKVSEAYKDFLVKRFKGPDYYFMWPFPKWFRRKLAKLEERIRAGKLTRVQRETYKFLRERAII